MLIPRKREARAFLTGREDYLHECSHKQALFCWSAEHVISMQMIFRTSQKTDKARHFRRMYDKKVNVLGLSAVMGLPDSVLPAEVQAGLPQLMAGAITLLVRLRDQEVSSLLPCLVPAWSLLAMTWDEKYACLGHLADSRTHLRSHRFGPMWASQGYPLLQHHW